MTADVDPESNRKKVDARDNAMTPSRNDNGRGMI